MNTIALLIFISATSSALEWDDFRVKWNTWLLDPFRFNSYFEIPRTLDDAVSAEWVAVEGLNGLDLTTYCYPDDGQLCVIFDGYGHIGGFVASILVDDFTGAADVYDPTDFAVYTSKTIFGYEYLTTVVYTVDPDILAAGGRSDWEELTGTAGVWFELSDGTYMEIARNKADLDPIWIEEACISEMGTHYYYNMSTTTECKNFFPYFLTFQGDELGGLGLQAFGSCTIHSRSWCEWVPAIAIKPTIPTTPQCLIDWAGEYGVISIHYYFASKPWKISC